jgi:serine/threonine protein kinase
VHRDVKPANILVSAGEAEHAYLCDFGLARQASSAPTLTGGAFVGTVAYSAPEQIQGATVDGRTDVYSLGCVLYECLTGVAPFRRAGDIQVLFAHVHAAPPKITARRPDLPPEIDAVLERALAKLPQERHATCCELIAELTSALGGHARDARDRPPGAPAVRVGLHSARPHLPGTGATRAAAAEP